MNYKILLGILLSIVFSFWRIIISFVVDMPFGEDFWLSILIDLFVLITIFSAVSLVRTIALKKRFEGREIYQVTGSFLLFLFIVRIGFFAWSILGSGVDLGVVDTVGVLLYASIRNLSIFGIEVLIASYFLNIFQAIYGMKSKLDIPFSQQIKVTLGLIVSIAAIGFLYEGMFRFNISQYGTTLFFSIVGGAPLIASVFLLRKPPTGFKLKKENHEEFFKDVKEIANKIGVDEPYEILVTPTTEIAVTGIVKKRLVLGIATLNKLTKGELKSIVGHEFGHFYGEDTIIGYIIANIRLGLELIVRFIPTYLFAIIFSIISYVFGLITLSYSRQVEYRADMVSARIFGGKNFSNALLNYVTYATLFDQNSLQLVQEVSKQGKVFKNVYQFIASNTTEKMEIETKRSISSRKTSLLSTHPGTGDRIKKVEKLSNLHQPQDSEQASNYFKDFNKLQEEATYLLTAYYIHFSKEK